MPSVTVPLTDDQALALEAICKAEYRSPEEHVRMLIDDHISDYTGGRCSKVVGSESQDGLK